MKVMFLVAVGEGLVTKKKNTFFDALKMPKRFPQENVATKLEGGISTGISTKIP